MKQIIALGGGGFGKEPEQLPIQRYILEASGKAQPKVCLIPTAGAENKESILTFYQQVLALGGLPDHLSLFQFPTADLEGFLLAQDIIFVGGGNTRSMMALWREWDLFCILRMAWEQGIVLSGVSAGGNCWFEQGITNSVPGLMGWVACSGIAAGSFCPHFDSQVERRPGYERMLLAGEVQDGYGVDEFAALHLRDDRAPQAVRFGENASVTRMTARNGAVESSALPDLVSLI